MRKCCQQGPYDHDPVNGAHVMLCWLSTLIEIQSCRQRGILLMVQTHLEELLAVHEHQHLLRNDGVHGALVMVF